MSSRKSASIEVCYGPQCSDAGSRELGEQLKACGHAITMGDCRGQCPHAPLVLIDQSMVTRADIEKVQQKLTDTEH